jgi:DTW domain-containing protein YfiP
MAKRHEPAVDPNEPVCPYCLKPMSLSVCDTVAPIDNRIELLILAHPQEQERLIGTGRLAAHHLAKATFRVGLSWPSLAKALGRDADPKRWGVLFLGSIKPEDFPAGRDVAVFDRQGQAVANQDAALRNLDGVVILDGTWSQAKTLWWRNGWVLKCRRIALKPKTPSLYGKVRREPRRDGLSTIEAAAFLISRLENRLEIEKQMLSTFRRMLQRYRDAAAGGAGSSVARTPSEVAT